MPPRSLSGPAGIELALQRVGELLAAAGERYAVVVVGGAALNLLGIVARATRDVDILAFAKRRPGSGRGWRLEEPSQTVPEPLSVAIRTVARDMGLADNWLNTGPALQWKQGLPRGFAGRVAWRKYAALHVGLAGRADLIRLKLYAAADGHPGDRHVNDLVALDPTDAELRAAARWVKAQDAGAAFPGMVDQVVAHVRARRGTRGT
jgi:hypothetical protein